MRRARAERAEQGSATCETMLGGDGFPAAACAQPAAPLDTRKREDEVTDLSEEEIARLNQSLDELIAAIDRVAAEVHATTAALRKPESYQLA